MLVLGAALLGIIIGTTIAKRRKGNKLDILQYAAVYGIAFTLLGLFATVFIERSVG